MAKVTDADMEKYISGSGKMFKFRDPRNGTVTEFVDNASNRGKVKRIVQRYMSIRGDGTHKDYLRKKAGTAEAVGAIALFAIPGGGFIRLGTMGTKAAANALKVARAKFPKGKVVNNPSAAQVRNAKPVGSVPAGGSRTKPTPKDKPTTIRQDKPRVRVPAGSSKKPTPPPRRPGLASNRQRVDGKPIKTPSTQKESGRPMSIRQMKDKVKANEAKRTTPPKPLTAAQRAAIAGRSAAPAVKGAVSDTTKATRGPARTTPDTSSERGRKGTPKRAGKPRTAPNVASEAGRSGTPKRKTPKSTNREVVFKPRFAPGMNVLKDIDYSIYGKSSPSKKKKNDVKPTPKVRKGAAASKRMPASSKRTTPSTASEKGRKGTPKRTGKLRTAPNTVSEAGRKGTPKRTTKITAGPGVGFGPKGNQFPKDAADRRRLMAMYGGTGSAAAKAAAQGKQGNLKKGKK